MTETFTDIAIVGGGLAGCIVADQADRAGHTVVLIDRHPEPPPGFRAEQLVGGQVAALERLGLAQALTAGLTPAPHAVGARGGRIIGGVDEIHYGLSYQAMVARVRNQLPPRVTRCTGRVADIETGSGRHTVTLAGGERVSARLVVLASGQERALAQHLGVGRRVIRAAHSITIGLDIVPVEDGFRMPLLTCYPTDLRFAIDYLAIFPIGSATRVNLFGYASAGDPWVQSFRTDPRAALLAAFPHLERILGPFAARGPAQLRINDLWASTDPGRDGLLLIGDAFRTSCPATGTGVSRILLDAELLSREYLAGWLDAQGPTAERIAAFYQDPRKLEFEETVAQSAEYQRTAATDPTLRWRLHRWQLAVRQNLGGWFGGPAWLTTDYTIARLPPDAPYRQPAKRAVAA
jgi:2-polyprenyl-6-methoxyphenol hydroxylase-like FAD-dependent oxidoreductase